MSGRFFAVPVFVGVAGLIGVLAGGLGAVPRLWGRVTAGGTAAIAALGLLGAIPQPAHVIDARGIGDERRFWQDALSLGAVRDGRNLDRIGWVRAAKAARRRGEPEVVVRGGIGLYGYYCGPRIHVIDRFALADPLLSRLPARANCRPGHFVRRIPEGYVASVEQGRNLLTDPDLHEYYATVRTLTIDPVFSPGRMAIILRFQAGALDRPLQRYLDRRRDWLREPVNRRTDASDFTIEDFYTSEP